MRISWRIFCATYIVVFIAIASVGYALVERNNTYIWNKTKEEALSSNETAGQLLIKLVDYKKISYSHIQELEKKISEMIVRTKKENLEIYTFTEIFKNIDNTYMVNLSVGQQRWDIITRDNITYLQIICMIPLNEENYYIQTMWDLTDIYEQKNNLIDFYGMAVLVGAFIGGIILLFISHFIAVPIRQLSKGVNEIAQGDYDKRINTDCSLAGIEITELSKNFNTMAETISNKVTELNQAVERREQFIADFTHELKTPMTAIIGYAELLRSYELDREERTQAASTIYREGKRLESLSMRLLELFVMQREESVAMQVVDLKSFFDELELSLRFLSEKYKVDIVFVTEELMVMVEPHLLYSLFYNIIDNACKASKEGQKVDVLAFFKDGRCQVEVKDCGRGIKEENIAEVMEPFYMEDKSRSRKQGGAGLGLALCQTIAKIHGSNLDIKSEQNKGTIVSFNLQIIKTGK